ncbi:PEP/pyruvate-binding domain-containing protein [Acanthopleuribacter pedis]|uniref:Phosphoenolpyruvate synthase n=1 Tax=Acanthopleuribacter pedis TaxID=442870 RepID=A0A8J7QCJ1_9BACT|nr:PEP/pyruvate-binding domain-containing protein [Acanthopleuribacter pedis]MBO1323206.1 hypothetical protein [Acanthopleuribacter pedis]
MPERANVGGKAQSLFRMAAEGLPVPDGAVLTTAFFASWYARLGRCEAWHALQNAAPEEIPALCEEVARAAAALAWSEDQEQVLGRVRRYFADNHPDALLIVRSSATDEDGVNASFAGIYETLPGVKPEDLDNAVRACFLASLDARVFQYRAQKNITGAAPQLALVIQPHLACDVAGVGFSLNPHNNDYEELVLTANWGQGESVVSGIAEPDTFIVEKHSGRLIEQQLGAKTPSLWLNPDGGLLERRENRGDSACLNEHQIARLLELIKRTEAYHGYPVDVEWAFVGEQLYLLQARPISVYVPLPPSMITAPGERRRLYADAALSKGITLNQAMSPLGLDWINHLFHAILASWVGPIPLYPKPASAFFFCTGGRMYINYSNLLVFSNATKLAKNAEATDTLMADILKSVDTQTYRAAKKPAWVGINMLTRLPRFAAQMSGFSAHVLWMLLFPKRAHRRAKDKIAEVERDLRALFESDRSLTECTDPISRLMVSRLFGQLMPMLVLGMLPAALAVRKPNGRQRRQLDQLQRGFDNHIVVEMGLALFRLGLLLDTDDLENPGETARRLREGSMPVPIQQAWSAFVTRFGFRGPNEMDLATPGYEDDPRIALNQITPMIENRHHANPERLHQEQVRARETTYQTLMGELRGFQRRVLVWLYRRWCLFTPTRDIPKYLITLCNGGMRRKALAVGAELVEAGRLDRAEDVFGLRFEEITKALTQPDFDARRAVQTNTAFTDKVRAHVRHFPPVIDSRGRILRPEPRSREPGVLQGSPVSPGTVTGPVKVLNRPDEKKIKSGDILVAYTTDPGWTPLFFNAGAVVLEVGGILQHGAVVARELGKPCISGIAGIVNQLEDGQVVEVNGDTGTLRLL